MDSDDQSVRTSMEPQPSDYLGLFFQDLDANFEAGDLPSHDENAPYWDSISRVDACEKALQLWLFGYVCNVQPGLIRNWIGRISTDAKSAVSMTKAVKAIAMFIGLNNEYTEHWFFETLVENPTWLQGWCQHTELSPSPAECVEWSHTLFFERLVQETAWAEGDDIDPRDARQRMRAALCRTSDNFQISDTDWPPICPANTQPPDEFLLPEGLRRVLAICLQGDSQRSNFTGTPQLAWTLATIAALLRRRRQTTVAHATKSVVTFARSVHKECICRARSKYKRRVVTRPRVAPSIPSELCTVKRSRHALPSSVEVTMAVGAHVMRLLVDHIMFLKYDQAMAAFVPHELSSRAFGPVMDDTWFQRIVETTYTRFTEERPDLCDTPDLGWTAFSRHPAVRCQTPLRGNRPATTVYLGVSCAATSHTHAKVFAIDLAMACSRLEGAEEQLTRLLIAASAGTCPEVVWVRRTRPPL